jgi:hypothetical protein
MLMILDLLRVFLLSLGIPWMLLGTFLLVTFVPFLIDHRFLAQRKRVAFLDPLVASLNGRKEG